MKQYLSSLTHLESIRPFARIRLIALDIDGTLATSGDRAVGPQLNMLSARLKAANVFLTVATGRAFAGARSVIENFSNEGAPIVLYNGAVVADRHAREIYYRATIPSSSVVAVAEIARARGGTVQAYDCSPMQHSLIDTSGKGLSETVVGWANWVGAEYDLNGIPIKWRRYGKYGEATEATALLVTIDSPYKSDVVSEMQSVPHISTTSSGSTYIEVRPAGVTKATGLAEVIRFLHLEASEVLTVGDNDNDVEMLGWAGIGVAVANATPSAISAASFLATREAGGGVIETMRVVQRSRRLFRDERKRVSGFEQNEQFPDGL